MECPGIIPIDEGYNDEMVSILRRSPVRAGGLSLYFDKGPDLFALPRMKYSQSSHAGFFMDGDLKGFGSLGYYNALVEGAEQPVFTFYQFYLLPEARGRNLPYRAMKTFLQQVHTTTTCYGIIITMKGNRATEAYIGRREGEWTPPTRVVDSLVVKTILFAKPMKNSTAYTVRTATSEDIPAIVTLLREEHRQRDFGLVYSEEGLLSQLQQRGLKIEDYYVATDSRDAPLGVCLAWDCSPVRRTTVLQYGASFYPWLAGYTALRSVWPMAPLPRRGESFKELTITDYAVKDRDPVIMNALLSEVYHRHHGRGYHFMNWGTCGSDPLLSAAKGFWCKDMVSHMVFTALDPSRYETEIRLPYIDIAFL